MFIGDQWLSGSVCATLKIHRNSAFPRLTFSDFLGKACLHHRRSFPLFSDPMYSYADKATSSPGPSPRSKWRSEKPLAKAAKVAPKKSSELGHVNTMK